MCKYCTETEEQDRVYLDLGGNMFLNIYPSAVDGCEADMILTYETFDQDEEWPTWIKFCPFCGKDLTVVTE